MKVLEISSIGVIEIKPEIINIDKLKKQGSVDNLEIMLVATSTWNEEWIKNSYKRILVKKSRKRGKHEKQEIWKFTIEKERKKGKKNKERKKESKKGRNKERKRVRKKERKKDINAY